MSGASHEVAVPMATRCNRPTIRPDTSVVAVRTSSADIRARRCRVEQGLAGRCEDDPTRMALEQFDAEVGLELGDRVGEARLGDVERGRRFGEAAVLGDRDRAPEVMQLHQGQRRGRGSSQTRCTRSRLDLSRVDARRLIRGDRVGQIGGQTGCVTVPMWHVEAELSGGPPSGHRSADSMRAARCFYWTDRQHPLIIRMSSTVCSAPPEEDRCLHLPRRLGRSCFRTQTAAPAATR